MATSFAASVADWVHETEGALEAIWRESANEMIKELDVTKEQGGNVPIVTGFLRASLLASTSMMPEINPAAKPPKGAGEGSFGSNASNIEAVIAGAEFGQTLFVGYTAAYAARMEFGFTGSDALGRYYSQPGNLFVTRAVQRWPAVVNRVSQRLSARISFS
ncbi:HK97 gp10 family phage protein [Amorphus sp. MBR-141]